MVSETDIVNFLENPCTLMVIGASNKKHRAGHYVPKFLQSKGFEIVPVNPNEVTVLDQPSLTKYSEYNGDVDAVLVYRHRKAAKKIAIELLENIEFDLLWFPDNITSQKVATVAKEHDVLFIQDRCPLRDYRNLVKE